ncbi:amino acid/amide ABC transporter substrate-binding protein (HAAT family) [Microcella putealis]|uniref:Amino acid/amide ABC transporter substrate-binding protein (HAAT family) n=1 Tax=Microcella putealis TaxID=337005 RepID=A0A4Q7LR44_9MICO|nr:ABC transporter substrate-binding protein [Microcella putealis]RZS56517.1 amino acid/amide ABC transporter substrate-binding protein (HAAT family) [Microcella putealis]TQM26997.1 amino acid/amide ABC transporter substrate-binding protein (HAAT family) [Microcella putealis]
MGVFTTARRSRFRTVLGGAGLLAASALVLAGCAAEAGEPATDDNTSAPTTPGEDLALKVGTILPQSGALAFLGPPEEAGVNLAVQEVNEAGLGISVEAILRDSGDTTTDIATVSVTDLLSQDVSAIIGAASSAVSLTVIDQITGAGVIQFSPANTSAAFTDYDDNGLYFRTAPSDVLQGEVLGNLIATDGIATLGLLVLNDAYGTGLAEFTSGAFEAAGGTVVAEELFNEGDTSVDAQVSALAAADPEAVAVITFDQANFALPALVNAGFTGEQLYLVDGNLADFSGVFEDGLIEGAKGTLPGLDVATLGDFQDRLLEVDPALTDYSYAAESYDAVILLALAALQAGSTDAAAIAAELQAVSGGAGDGEKCNSFAECAELIAAGTAIDYDGPSGPITFDENGDPTEATIGIYQYGADNNYTRIN